MTILESATLNCSWLNVACTDVTDELRLSLAIDSLAGHRTGHFSIVCILIIHEDELKKIKPGFKALPRAPRASNKPLKVNVSVLAHLTRDYVL